MPLRLKALLACLALVSALAAGLWVQGLRDENAALTARCTALEADLKASVKLRVVDQEVAAQHVVKQAILRASTRKSNEKLHTATTRNPRWADGRVPADVAAALGM
jgi:hypothetical protein